MLATLKRTVRGDRSPAGEKLTDRKKIIAINIRDLSRFESGSVVDEAALVGAGLVKGRRDGVKLLSNGDITYPLTIRLNLASKTAREKIEAAGGTFEPETRQPDKEE